MIHTKITKELEWNLIFINAARTYLQAEIQQMIQKLLYEHLE